MSCDPFLWYGVGIVTAYGALAIAWPVARWLVSLGDKKPPSDPPKPPLGPSMIIFD